MDDPDLTFYGEPELYDLVMSPDSKADALYLEEAYRRGGEVLDIACGGGRFSIPLARAGCKVVGLDLSSAMLEQARAKAAHAGVDIRLIQADMRDFDLSGRQFGLITITANSLLHLHNTDDMRRCFRAIARHLAPSGALLFDIFNPSVRILSRNPVQRNLVGHFRHERLGDLKLEETTDYDAASQINRTTWFWSTSAQPDFLVRPLHLRQVFPQELPLLVESCGFRLVSRYGDFNRSAFESQSIRQICICEPEPT